MSHKSGFVNILGNPNVGKSTLMNMLVGEKLSIITSKAQTTRHRILGIVNCENFQIIFSDTPGILKPAYKLQERMLNFVTNSIYDADVILYVTDVIEKSDKNLGIINKLKKSNIPILLLINKIDLSNQKEVEKLSNKWKELLPTSEIFMISALNNFNINSILNRILELLPEGPPYYDKNELTDKPQRFFASEIIREKIFLNYKKEIPYSVQVEIDEFKEKKDLIKIRAIIYVTRNSQKGIIIGHKGSAIKKIGIEARKDLEEFFQNKIFLETFVKVKNDWRNHDKDLQSFGYNV